MSAMASQITCLTIVYSTVFLGANERKPSKLRVTGLCAGSSPLTGEFPAQRASNAENVSIWWCHHVTRLNYFERKLYWPLLCVGIKMQHNEINKKNFEFSSSKLWPCRVGLAVLSGEGGIVSFCLMWQWRVDDGVKLGITVYFDCSLALHTGKVIHFTSFDKWWHITPMLSDTPPDKTTHQRWRHVMSRHFPH